MSAMFYRNDVPVSHPFQGRDLGFFIGHVQEAIWVSRGFPTADNESEGGATEGQDMAAGVSRDSHLEGRNSSPRYLYLQDSGNSGGVGGVASYLGGLHQRDMLRGGREAPGAVVEANNG